MQKYNNISFSASTCLTSEVMRNYLSNSLSKEEKRIVELHLADCEMCSDELEGLSLLDNPQKLNILINDLNSRIDNHTKSNKNLFLKKLRPYYSIAALILVLISISVFLVFQDFSSKEMQMAESIAKEEVELSNKPIIIEEKLAEDKSISKDTILRNLKRSKKQIAQDLNFSKNKKSSDKRINKDFITKNEVFDQYIALDSETLVSPSSNTFARVDTTTQKIISNENTKSLSLDEEKEEEVVNISEEIDDAEIQYSNISAEKRKIARSKSSSAKGTFSSVISTDSLDLAINEFKNKNFQKTIDLLEKQNFNKNSENFAKAKWYLALSYIELNETDKAKLILLQLSEFENSYQKKAKRKLKD